MPRKKEIGGVKVTLNFDESVLARLDRICVKTRLSRSRLIRNLVESSLDDVEALDAIGVLALVMKIEDAKASMRGVFAGKAMTT